MTKEAFGESMGRESMGREREFDSNDADDLETENPLATKLQESPQSAIEANQSEMTEDAERGGTVPGTPVRRKLPPLPARGSDSKIQNPLVQETPR